MLKSKLTIFTLLIALAGLIGVALFNQPPLTSVFATSSSHHNIWVTTNTGEFGACVPNEGTTDCKGGGGTKTRTLTQTCEQTSGKGEDECKIKTVYDCDHISQEIKGVVRNTSEFYNKNTGDDNHCHRIVWDNLGESKQDDFKDWYGSSRNYESAYNSHVDELANAHATVTPETREIQDTAECTIPANPDACEQPPVDVCINLVGDQTTLPTGMVANSDHFCSCDKGFHKVVNEEYVGTNQEDFTCQPDGTPTPTPTPEPQQPSSNGGGGTSQPSAPQCTDGSTIKLPANPHVLRHGDKADVNFFITQGDSANIYFKEVGQANWTHSVLRDEVKKFVGADGYVSYTIGDLKPELGYVFGIQQVQGCGGGETVIAVIVDGPTTQLFPFSYWEWAK